MSLWDNLLRLQRRFISPLLPHHPPRPRPAGGAARPAGTVRYTVSGTALGSHRPPQPAHRALEDLADALPAEADQAADLGERHFLPEVQLKDELLARVQPAQEAGDLLLLVGEDGRGVGRLAVEVFVIEGAAVGVG